MIQQAAEESARLNRLYALNLLDTEPEPEFDELVQLASAICETPISLMTLVDAERQWFKAAVGIELRSTPLDCSICAYAIQRPEMFMVEDTTRDARFAGYPHVLGSPYIRFYAGMPIEMGDGYRAGTLCVLDVVPRQLTDGQKNALLVLSRQVAMRMEMRLKRQALTQLVLEKQAIAQELRCSEQRFRAFMDNGPFVSFMKAEDGTYEYYNNRFAEVFATGSESWLATRDSDHFPKAMAEVFRGNDLAVLVSGKPAVLIETTIDKDGSTVWWQSHKFACPDAYGGLTVGCVAVDITENYSHKTALEASKRELEELNKSLKMLTLTDALTQLKTGEPSKNDFPSSFSAPNVPVGPSP